MGLSVQYSVDRHHCCLKNLPMLLLLPDCPSCRLPCESQPICTHEPPRTINKPTYDICWASIKLFDSHSFGFSKCLLWVLAISVLAPTPVLHKLIYHSIPDALLEAHHLNWVEFAVKFRQEETFVTGFLDKSPKHRWLVFKILLSAEKACHTAICVFPGTHW